jgi:hypothetical protein
MRHPEKLLSGHVAFSLIMRVYIAVEASLEARPLTSPMFPTSPPLAASSKAPTAAPREGDKKEGERKLSTPKRCVKKRCS